MTVRLLSVHGQIAGLMWRHTFLKFEKNTQVSWFAVVSIGGNIAKQRLAEIFLLSYDWFVEFFSKY